MTGILRYVLEEAVVMDGYSAQDLTVLAIQHDPFRVDTPARHRDGKWLADWIVELRHRRLIGGRVHLRKLHYKLIGLATKPNGKPYINTEQDWRWLQEHAVTGARWLGYVPWDQIIDAHNDEPVIRIAEPPGQVFPHVAAEAYVDLPESIYIKPFVSLSNFEAAQPFRLVLFGEKSSLEDVLGPIADAYDADLYLPTGELSATLLHRMATVAAEDGRKVIVFCVSDCDPSGWQMPISIGRKLQAFEYLLDGLEFEVHRVALTPAMSGSTACPSTPMKPTQKRASKWRQAMGVEKTEVDAMDADALRQIVRDAIAPFYDHTLDRRVSEARSAWEEQAEAALDAVVDHERREELRDEIQEQLDAVRGRVAEINQELHDEVEGLILPDVA
jgi:hypothetical protein